MRIDDDIYNRIEQAKGDKTKVEFLRELIINSLNPNLNSAELIHNSNELNPNSTELKSAISQLKTELEHQKEIDNISRTYAFETSFSTSVDVFCIVYSILTNFDMQLLIIDIQTRKS